MFHLLFQETITVRYALPTLPLVAWLAAGGFSVAGRFAPRRWRRESCAASLVVSVPVGLAYGASLIRRSGRLPMPRRERGRRLPPRCIAHYSLWRALQADPAGLPLVEPRRQYEWLGPVEYWKGGGTGPVWFLADPRRTDLALIDPLARQDVTRLPVGRLPTGRSWAAARPLGADWYRIAAPGWFAGEGWSLTPETGGLAQASAAGPDHRPIEAWVRRRPGPLHLVVGGRHLGEPGDPAADFELALDGVVRDRWTLTVDERNFLRFLDIPGGTARRRRLRPPDDCRRAAPAATRGGRWSACGSSTSSRRIGCSTALREGWHEEELRSDDRSPLALDERAIGAPDQRRHRRGAHHAARASRRFAISTLRPWCA